MLTSIAAISVGASLGALLRWVLGMKLNAVLPAIPLGTLAANLIGGYVIGLCVAYFAARPDLPPQVRLFLITGFCGGLTTFSTFSAEVVDLLQKGDLTAGSMAIVAHVAGSLSMTLLGMVSWHWLASD
ncbi:MAG TPA: fluoride efflux transporter CrcB [Usitatibacter sp.]|nr:fluoride efflux transporter CrcB [Usitatibacter sp.]